MSSSLPSSELPVSLSSLVLPSSEIPKSVEHPTGIPLPPPLHNKASSSALPLLAPSSPSTSPVTPIKCAGLPQVLQSPVPSSPEDPIALGLASGSFTPPQSVEPPAAPWLLPPLSPPKTSSYAASGFLHPTHYTLSNRRSIFTTDFRAISPLSPLPLWLHSAPHSFMLHLCPQSPHCHHSLQAP